MPQRFHERCVRGEGWLGSRNDADSLEWRKGMGGSMRDRLHGSQVSKARPGAPLGFLPRVSGMTKGLWSDCLNCQGIGGAHLEVEAEDSDLYCPPGRVPHVCAGVAGALHGLNKMGRSPFRCYLSPASKPKNEKNPSTGEPRDLQSFLHNVCRFGPIPFARHAWDPPRPLFSPGSVPPARRRKQW